MYFVSLCVGYLLRVDVLRFSMCSMCRLRVRVNVLRVSKCRLRVTCYVSLCVGYVIVCIVLEYTHAITLTWCVCVCVCVCVCMCVCIAANKATPHHIYHALTWLRSKSSRSYLILNLNLTHITCKTSIHWISILPDFKSEIDTHHLQDFNLLNPALT